MEDEEAVCGFKIIAEKFVERDYYGQECVARFAEREDVLDGCTWDQWQTDAYGQVCAWLKGMGLI